MKIIEPITIWGQGIKSEAIKLNASAQYVNFNISATIYYSLHDAEGKLISDGYLTLEGEDYQLWNNDTFAWDWIAEKLNLTIIGDYVNPDVTETQGNNIL
jgi:hypothetical protein